MPTYQFRCPDGSIIERFYKISEVPDSIPAPDGSGQAVRIISGGAGLIFKGSGFYITDYGKDGKKDQRQAASKNESGSESGSAAGDKATPAAKPATPSPATGGGSAGSGGSTGGGSTGGTE
jgi:predicted nucleic acid-binding Zn ribbon protein